MPPKETTRIRQYVIVDVKVEYFAVFFASFMFCESLELSYMEAVVFHLKLWILVFAGVQQHKEQ